jgi:hypothetical protein
MFHMFNGYVVHLGLLRRRMAAACASAAGEFSGATNMMIVA